jgi:hypothetical protein
MSARFRRIRHAVILAMRSAVIALAWTDSAAAQARPAPAAPATPPAATAVSQHCQSATLNGPCFVEIDRERPVSPLPIRVTSKAEVTLRVHKRPLEQILFDVTVVETAAPDPLSAIFSAFVTPLKSFVGSVTVIPPSGPPVAPPPPAAKTPAELVADTLNDIGAQQETAATAMTPVEKEIKRVGRMLRAFQTHDENWDRDWWLKKRQEFSCAVLQAPMIDKEACPAAQPAGTLPLPVGVIRALRERVTTVTKQYAALSLSATKETPNLIGKMNEVSSFQDQLEASLASLRTGQAALVDAATLLNGIDETKVSPTQDQPLGGASTYANRQATVKIAAQDLISKATTGLGTVVITWGGTNWEMSGGALFSALQSRTYQNSPIIVNGQPKLDAAGKISTRISESDTRPMIIPAVMAHYRFLEGVPAGQSQRLALLWTAAVGVNPYSGSADIATGPTFSYRGFMVTPALHFTRDLRLTNGLVVGQELGSSPPALSTERYWVRKFAVGLSYRVPIN